MADRAACAPRPDPAGAAPPAGLPAAGATLASAPEVRRARLHGSSTAGPREQQCGSTHEGTPPPPPPPLERHMGSHSAPARSARRRGPDPCRRRPPAQKAAPRTAPAPPAPPPTPPRIQISRVSHRMSSAAMPPALHQLAARRPGPPGIWTVQQFTSTPAAQPPRSAACSPHLIRPTGPSAVVHAGSCNWCGSKGLGGGGGGESRAPSARQRTE